VRLGSRGERLARDVSLADHHVMSAMLNADDAAGRLAGHDVAPGQHRKADGRLVAWAQRLADVVNVRARRHLFLDRLATAAGEKDESEEGGLHGGLLSDGNER